MYKLIGKYPRKKYTFQKYYQNILYSVYINLIILLIKCINCSLKTKLPNRSLWSNLLRSDSIPILNHSVLEVDYVNSENLMYYADIFVIL